MWHVINLRILRDHRRLKDVAVILKLNKLKLVHAEKISYRINSMSKLSLLSVVVRFKLNFVYLLLVKYL